MKGPHAAVSSTNVQCQISDNSIYPPIEQRTVCKGNVVLYLRKRSQQWQANIRRISGKWHTVTTGTTDLEKAKRIGARLYEEMLHLRGTVEIDIPQKFVNVAKLTIKELEQTIDEKNSYHYINAIKKYLIPVFGEFDVHDVKHDTLKKLDAYRLNLLGKVPSKSLVNTHNVALAKVFTTALHKGYIAQSQIPVLHNNGQKGKARPHFELDEIPVLVNSLDAYSQIGRKTETRFTCSVLRSYVLILINTGMRTGREALSLKWSSIRLITLPGTNSTVLEFSVSGKTGKRSLIAKDDDGTVTKCLQQLQALYPDIANLSFNELLKKDLPVFRTMQGERMKHGRLGKFFQKCLTKYELLKNQHGEIRTLYSLRHSYATFRIIEGIDMATLAVQMGTSIGMLEKHYSHLKPYMKAHILHGLTDKPSADTQRLEDMLKQQQELISKQNTLITQLLAKA